MTEERFKYYTEGAPTLEEFNKISGIDGDRIESLNARAIMTVTNGRDKYPRTKFKSDTEYKYYLSIVEDTARAVKAGLM